MRYILRIKRYFKNDMSGSHGLLPKLNEKLNIKTGNYGEMKKYKKKVTRTNTKNDVYFRDKNLFEPSLNYLYLVFNFICIK